MKKTLIAATSAVALMVGATSPAWAFLDDQVSVAVASSTLVQVQANTAATNNAVILLQANAYNNNFGANTFQNQVLSTNNINSGPSSALQGSTTSAIAANVNSN